MPANAGRVKWYSCGPTVYDAAHLGHARTYVTFDLLKRVMREFFGFDTQYVMNVTDIDDKIIIRAHQASLFDEFSKSLDSETAVAQIGEHIAAGVAILESQRAKLSAANGIFQSC